MLEVRRTTSKRAKKLTAFLSAKVQEPALGSTDRILELGRLLESRLEFKMNSAEMVLALVEAVLEIEFGRRNIKKEAWRRMAGVIAGAILKNRILNREAGLYLSRIALRKIKARE